MTQAGFVPPSRFRILRRLGEGGSGVVYEAVDQDRGVRVALKTLREVSPRALARLEQEFRSLQDLEHKNLVRFGELCADRDPCFFTMELVEGTDLLSHVRGASGEIHEARLRDAFAQLTRALLALHEAKKIHRDVKPSNIRVTHDGRVVLLDFGLVTDAEPEGQSLRTHAVGTAAYMAPEQAALASVGPETDWYAVGCVLYEALTGRVPFLGSPVEVMMAKQTDEPAPPRRLAPSTPADLDVLCSDLLRFHPASRPSGHDVHNRLLEPTRTSVSRTRAARPATVSGDFVGREQQLRVLRDAFEKTRQGGAVSIFVEGESGVGKSALVGRFVDLLAADLPVLVLAGRCREHESIPYKALDGVIDELTAFLRTLADEEVEAVLPRNVALLAQVFPVLRRVDAVAAKARVELGSLDPQEQRRRVFAACRDLLGRLTITRAVVMVIDDLQWADANSLALLAEVMRPPDAPPLLFLATTRVASVEAEAPLPVPGVAHVRVEPLPPEDALALAERLASNATKSGNVDAAAIAREAKGHPLFIDELVRHAAAGESGGSVVRLDDALWARVLRLDEPSLDLMRLVAVGGMPMRSATLAEAAKLTVTTTNKLLAALRGASLVRATSAHGADASEPYHDRVREAVLGKLAAEEKRALHERIARALELASPPDTEALFTHWREAADVERAAVYAERAGAAAEEALAFDHAARLLRYALELQTRGGEDSRALRRRLAEALANAGLGAEAGREFLLAAATAPPSDALSLQHRATEQFLFAGLIDEGLAVARDMLAPIGMQLPRTRLQALLGYLFRRFLLWLRGMKFVERAASELPPRDLTIVDICWSLSFAFAATDSVRGADFQARNLLLALKLGEPYRVALAFAMETLTSSSVGAAPWTVSQANIARAAKLAQSTRSPYAIAFATGTAGTAAVLAGHFKLGLAQLDEAQEQLRDLAGTWNILVRVRTFAVNALAYMGEVEEIGRRVPLYLREAEEHGDLHAATNFRIGYASLPWLVRDDPRGARDSVTNAMARWRKDGFAVEHYFAFLGHVQADLYAGEARAARERVLADWAPMRRAFLLRIPTLRVVAFYVRARSAISLAGIDRAQRAALVREARELGDRCLREGIGFAPPLGVLIHAGCASVLGEAGHARALFGEAAAKLDAVDMALHAAACRYSAAEILGGADGEVARDEAARWMQARTIVAPAKMSRMLAPRGTP